MTKSDSLGTSETRGVQKAISGHRLTSTARVDAPHELASSAPESTADQREPALKPISDEPASEQLRLQADQLAAHLQGWQKALDHREAELNSRMARWESEVRAARLWMEQREGELISRGQAPAEQRQAEELVLAAQQLETQRRELQQAMADLEQRRQAVQRRAGHVDQCRLAFEQLRAELAQMHRETLEIRLATEELWVELSGAAPPAALVRSLGRIRTKLADQYAQANAELVQRKTELEAIRGQLIAQHEKLLGHKQRVEQWVAGRQEECEQQASRLVAREREIHREQIRLRGRSQC